MSNFTLGQAEYAQLRSAALSTLNFTLSRYDAQRYEWMDDEEKADIVSDAIMKAMMTYREDGGRSLKGWTRMIASQLTTDAIKSHRESFSTTYIGEDDEELEIRELAGRATPEDEVIAWETQDTIERVLDGRGETDGKVFKMESEGYRPAEIAQELGLTLEAVYMRLHKTRKAVSKVLAA